MHNPGVWQTLVRISETWPSANNSCVVKKKSLLSALLVVLLWFYKLWNKKTAAPFGPRNKQTVTCDSLLFLGTKQKPKVIFPSWPKNYLLRFLRSTACLTLRLCTVCALPFAFLQLHSGSALSLSCLRVQCFLTTAKSSFSQPLWFLHWDLQCINFFGEYLLSLIPLVAFIISSGG